MSVCRTCGKPVIWGVKYDGGKVPLDRETPVYAIVKVKDAVEIVRTDLSIAGHRCLREKTA